MRAEVTLALTFASFRARRSLRSAASASPARTASNPKKKAAAAAQSESDNESDNAEEAESDNAEEAVTKAAAPKSADPTTEGIPWYYSYATAVAGFLYVGLPILFVGYCSQNDSCDEVRPAAIWARVSAQFQ